MEVEHYADIGRLICVWNSVLIKYLVML